MYNLDEELDPEAPRPRFVGPRKPFDIEALRAAASADRAMDEPMPIPDGPTAPMPRVAAAVPPEFSRVLGVSRRAEGVNPRVADYEEKAAAAAKIKGERPVEPEPKWWQRLAAAGVGGLAGAVNSGGRVRADASGALDAIYGGEGKRRRLADWTSRLEGAEAEAQAAKGTLDAWRQGETLDRQNRMADAQIEHLEAQAERDRATATNPKRETQLIGSDLFERAPNGEWRKVAAGTEKGEIIPAGSTVFKGGKAVYTAPEKTPAERNLNVNDVLLNPDKYTPAQVKKAQEMFDKQHRPPASQASGNDDALVNAVIANPLIFDNLTPTAKTRISPKLQAAGFENFGKPASEGTITKMTETQSAIASLGDLRKTLLENEQYIGPIAGYQALNPWSEARKAQAKIDLVKQRVGKALEGGVLRKEDEDKYKKILATLNDEPSTAIAKVDGLIQTLERDAKIFQDQQRASGRRVAGGGNAPKATEPAGGGPAVGAVVNGHRFKGGDPNKKENWQAVK